MNQRDQTKLVQRESTSTHLIPQTIKDWPRRQSPAAKTPSTLVKYFLLGVRIFERASWVTPSASIASGCGPKKPRARKTSCAEKYFSEPGTSSIFQRPP